MGNGTRHERTVLITLFDLSADFWRNFYATKSDVGAYDLTLESIKYYTNVCQRTAVLCDAPRCKRYDWFPEYKANRKGTKPQEAIDSLQAIKEQVEACGTVIVECDGYEADDLMATLVKQAWPDDAQLVTRDKDLYQLISDSCWLAGKSGLVREPECIEKFGVKPGQIRDFLALTGDAADNIPGCPHTGPGRARDLLQRFQTIKGIQAASDEDLLSVRGIGLKTLTAFRAWDPALAVRLVTLLDDAPVNLEELWPS